MTTLLVDGNNVLARATHAAHAGRTKMSVDGVNTSALLIFINLLSKYVRQVKPTHMAVCWDHGHDARDKIDPAYKANRNPHSDLPEEEQSPFGQAKAFLTWASIPHIGRRGWEADDVIAVISRHANTPRPVVILSGDRDLLQLVDRDVTQIRLPDDEPWTVARVTNEFCHPQSIPLMKALTGDTGDNVVGVRGIGPKKAVALLDKAEWQWEPLLALLSPEQAAQAITARRLVDLRYPEFAAYADDPLTFLLDIAAPVFAPTAPDGMLWEPLVEFLKKWEMNSVLSRLSDGSLWYQGGSHDSTAEAFAGFDV